jgi:hypothetical protein
VPSHQRESPVVFVSTPSPEHFDGIVFDDQTQSALAACLFSPPRLEHIWWTLMVVDPALHDTASHIRLVGHYETEFEAVGAADRLAAELNCCLVPGEAPLTTTPLGIEPEAANARARDQIENRTQRSAPSPIASVWNG